MSNKEISASMPAPFKLEKFDVATGAEAGFDLHILSPAGEDSGVVFRVLGRDSKAYQELALKQQRDRISKAQKAGGRMIDFDAEAFVEQSSRLLASATVSWSEMTLDGVLFDCTPDNAFELYSDPRFVDIREQVERAIGDRANFTKS